jgi:tetratricopeptide (TPR) repeat protein
VSSEFSAPVEAARALLEIGRDAEAARILRDVVRTDPHDAIALGLLAEAVRDADPSESDAAAKAALAIEPDNAWVVTIAAWSADAVRNTDETIRLIRTAQALDPTSVYVHRSAAQLLAVHRETRSEALAAATRAIELAPNDADTWVAAGNASIGSERLDEARTYYEYALRLDPTNLVAQRNLAEVHDARGSMMHAMELLNTLVAVNPTDHASRARIDEVAKRLLQEMVWFCVPVGFVLALVFQLVAEALR